MLKFILISLFSLAVYADCNDPYSSDYLSQYCINLRTSITNQAIQNVDNFRQDRPYQRTKFCTYQYRCTEYGCSNVYICE
jgi:hypothetical protein